MITVQAASRLHFGLFSLATDSHWANSEGQRVIPARRFGGVGLMVESPGIRVRVEPADSWSAEGPLAERALSYARTFADQLIHPPEIRPHRIIVEQSAPEHVGLGTGTQLGLSIARALVAATGGKWQADDAAYWSERLARGKRSAVGTHGFNHGGFLVEAGKHPPSAEIAPLIVRSEFPPNWRIALVVHPGTKGLHGRQEQDALARLYQECTPLPTVEALSRLVLLGMLPALVQRDLPAFGEALYDFNRRVGELFAPVQGGPYADHWLGDAVAYIRKHGAAGVGQSSWGGTLFAVTVDEDRAKYLRQKIRRRFLLEPEQVICTAACNHGATVTGEPGA